jgi:hypothetical protein
MTLTLRERATLLANELFDAEYTGSRETDVRQIVATIAAASEIHNSQYAIRTDPKRAAMERIAEHQALSLLYRSMEDSAIRGKSRLKSRYCVTPRQIGEALAKICRYAGRSKFQSVLLHSLCVADFLQPSCKLFGLIHDM